MKVGDVIADDRGLWVIKEMIGNVVTKIELLEAYVTRNMMLPFNGELKTMKEIIDIHCNEYIRSRGTEEQ